MCIAKFALLHCVVSQKLDEIAEEVCMCGVGVVAGS